MTTPVRPPGSALHAVLLDIDGTLIASNDAHARSWVAAFSAHGYDVPFQRVRPLIGKGGDKLVPELTGLDADSGEAERIGESRGAIFREQELPTLRATPGSRDLLVRLRDAGLLLVVATSAQADEVTAILEQAGVSDLIEFASTSGDAEHSKPDPDIIRAALRKSGSLATQSVMIGDTPYDIEAAARAGVPTIALRCGGWWDDAALAGAVEIHDDPAGLLQGIRNSALGRVVGSFSERLSAK